MVKWEMKKNRRREDAALLWKIQSLINFFIISLLLFHLRVWSNKINSSISEVIFMIAEQKTLIVCSYVVCIYSLGINVRELEKGIGQER